MTIQFIEDRLIKLSLMFFLIFEFFAGPLRWLFNMIGAEVLYSTPKGMILLSLIVSIVNTIYKRKITTNGFIATLILCYVLGMGLIGSEPAAIFLGFWGVMPVFLGYHSTNLIFNYIVEKKSSSFAVVIFLLSCIGVMMNIFIKYPWYDVSYQIAGMDVSSAEMGTTGGFTRYAGFFKSSLQASANVFILLLYLVATIRSKFLILFCFIMSAAVSLITISKTVFALHLILLVYIFIKALPVKLLWRSTLVFGILATIFTISSTNYTFIVSDDTLSIMLLGSLDARLTTTWPSGVETIMQNGSLFFGGGMGTIGVGSKLGSGVYNPGDSMYLYIIGTGGYFLAMMLLMWSYYQSFCLDNSAVSRFISMTLIVICLFGVSMTTPEYPLMALSFGMIFNSRVIRFLK